MSKGLEALKKTFGSFDYYKSYDIIEKELKALEIIKDKLVSVDYLLYYIKEIGGLAFHTYNSLMDNERKLTREEYELLKEVLL